MVELILARRNDLATIIVPVAILKSVLSGGRVILAIVLA